MGAAALLLRREGRDEVAVGVGRGRRADLLEPRLQPRHEARLVARLAVDAHHLHELRDHPVGIHRHAEPLLQCHARLLTNVRRRLHRLRSGQESRHPRLMTPR